MPDGWAAVNWAVAGVGARMDVNWASPIWLLAVLPWAGGAFYLLARTRSSVGVPNLRLWGGSHPGSPRTAKRGMPPAGVVLGLVASLLAIFAAAGPLGRGRGRGVVRVVLDRGIGAGNGRPFRGVLDRASELLGDVTVQLECVPPAGSAEVVGPLATVAGHVGPVAADTGEMLDAKIASVLREPGAGPIVVLTDRRLATPDRRVVRVTPTESLDGIGIEALAARERPRPQVMIRVVNRSDRTQATLRLSSAGETIDRGVELLAAGGPIDRFVDVPSLGPTIAVSVDDRVLDGRAWLARQGDAAGLVATPGVPVALRRMVDVFNASLPSGSPRNIVVSDRPIPADRAGVWVTGATEGSSDVASVVAHAVTDGVRVWAAGGGVAPPGFRTVVSRKGGAVVAVREGLTRQVWASFDVLQASTSADWVVFLANAFRWVGGDAAAYEAMTPRELGEGWDRIDSGPMPAGVEAGLWPGLYRSPAGRVVAVNGALGDRDPPSIGDETVMLPINARVNRPFGGLISTVAVAFLGVAALVWPRRRNGQRLT